MNFKSITLTAASVLAAASVTVPAFAQPYGNDDGYRGDDRSGSYSDDSAYRNDDRRGDDRNDGRYNDGRDNGRYDDRYDANRNDGYRDYYRNGRYDRQQYDRYDGRGGNCRDNRVAGTILGAIAGGVLGAQVDRHGSNDGSVAAGAVIGGLVGNNVARGSAACDQYGRYYGYQQTTPWRSDYAYGRGYRGSDRSDWGRRGCRLAVMSTGGYDRGQYVTVCPDRYGRYRVR